MPDLAGRIAGRTQIDSLVFRWRLHPGRGPDHGVATWVHMGGIGRRSQLDFESQLFLSHSVTSREIRQLGKWAVPKQKEEWSHESSHGQQLFCPVPPAGVHTRQFIEPFFTFFSRIDPITQLDKARRHKSLMDQS